MGSSVQYAQLPKFEYQEVASHYQTFDRRTLKSSYYPVNSTVSRTTRLTPEKDQGDGDEPNVTEDAPAGDDVAAPDAGMSHVFHSNCCSVVTDAQRVHRSSRRCDTT